MPNDSVTAVARCAPVSGYCGAPSVNGGKNVLWTMTDGNSDGVYETITISKNSVDPQGDNFYMGYNTAVPPWYDDYRSTITTAVIQDGVQGIGLSAFRDCSSLASVTMADSVASIGVRAFEGCVSLAAAPIGNGVIRISDLAFCECTGITSARIPAAVTTLSHSAFDSCSGLTAIAVDDGNTVFSAKDGVLFTYNGELLYLYPYGKKGAYTVPSGVIGIGTGAFGACPGLTSLTLQDGVRIIDKNAVSWCRNLTSISFPDSLVRIAGGSLHETPWMDNQPAGMVYAGRVAYKYTGNAADVAIRDGIVSVTDSAFFGTDSLQSLVIPATVTWIGDAAFNSCDHLRTVYLLPADSPTMEQITFDEVVPECRFYVHGNTYDSQEKGWAGLWASLRNRQGALTPWTGEKTVIWAVTCSADASVTGSQPVISYAGADYFTEGAAVALKHREPDEGYLFGGYVVNGKRIDGDSFTMPAGDAAVSVDWLTSLQHTDVSASVPGQTYTGSALTPVLTVKHGNTVLTEGTDYTVSWSRGGNETKQIVDAGEYTATITGKGAYGGTRTETFTVAPKSITGAAVTLDKTQLTYSGAEQGVSVTGVAAGGLALTPDDYTVTGNRGTNKGTYTVTVTGRGNCKDTATASWQILEKAMTVSAANVTVPYDGKARGVTVSVTDPSAGAAVKYGRTAGVYDLDASPTIKDAGTLAVYFRVTAPNYTDYTGVATVTVTRIDAAVTAMPKAKTGLVCTGSALELIEAGKADGGTMQYVLRTDSGTAPASGWGEKIPAATEAGTYYVWYMVKGDGNHNDSTPAVLTVKIKEKSEEPEKPEEPEQPEQPEEPEQPEQPEQPEKPEGKILPGDVNEDGEVDGRDAIRLMKYLAGEEDPETGKVYEINKKNADVKADGKTDEKDLLRLVQYLCGMPVTLEEGTAE